MASNRQTREEPGQTMNETRGKAATEAGKERCGAHRGTRTDVLQNAAPAAVSPSFHQRKTL